MQQKCYVRVSSLSISCGIPPSDFIPHKYSLNIVQINAQSCPYSDLGFPLKMQKLFSDLEMQKIVLSGSLTPPLVMPLPPSDFTLHAYPLSIVQVNVQSQLLILVPHTHATLPRSYCLLAGCSMLLPSSYCIKTLNPISGNFWKLVFFLKP